MEGHTTRRRRVILHIFSSAMWSFVMPCIAIFKVPSTNSMIQSALKREKYFTKVKVKQTPLIKSSLFNCIFFLMLKCSLYDLWGRRNMDYLKKLYSPRFLRLTRKNLQKSKIVKIKNIYKSLVFLLPISILVSMK